MAYAAEIEGIGGGRPQTRAERKAAEEWQKIQDAAEPVISSLVEMASERVRLRKPIETRWLEDLRQYHGHYEKNTAIELKNDESRSETFINITRTKTNAWAARLGDMLLPNDEKNWGIDPTPLPDLSREAREITTELERLHEEAEAAAEEHNEAAAAGAISPGMPSEPLAKAQQAASLVQEAKKRDAQLQREIEEATKRCKAMERLIDDQLTEARFPAKCRDTINDMCKLGVGILKGPVVSNRPKRKWEVDAAGNASLQTVSDTAPNFRRVDPWHFFPDMSAATMDESESTLERYLPNRKLLRKMAREMKFNEHTVRQLLKDKPGETPSDTAGDLAYLSELRGLEKFGTDEDGALGPLKDRYVVWEYRGPLEIEDIAKMIRATGRMKDADEFEAEADPLEERMVTVWFCNGKLLSIEEEYLLDSGASLYSVASFEKAEASILGAVGVPRLMKHEQAMINAAVRMVMDNAALSVSPQVVVDATAIEPENGSWKLTARKVWRRIKGSAEGAGAAYKPFDVFPIPLNQAQLAAIVEMAMRFVDEAVAMPLIAQGEQGAHVTNTAHGMTMLMNSANVVFRRVVKNYDDDMIGLIHRAYDYNMQFSNDPSVKGDAKIEARGTSVLLVREIQSQQLQMILREWSTHPIMGVGLRAYNAMRMVLQAMSINPDDMLISEDEYLEKLKQMAAPDEEGESPDAAKLQIAELDATVRREQMANDVQIAEIRRETEMLNLGQKYDLSLKQIEAMFRGKELDTAAKLETKKIDARSKERTLAAEISLERENKREAEAKGLEPTGSGGAISMGGEKPA